MLQHLLSQEPQPEIAQQNETLSIRARLNSRSEKLGKKRIGLTAMYELLLRYLEKLPVVVRKLDYSSGCRG